MAKRQSPERPEQRLAHLDASSFTARPRPEQREAAELHICPHCASELVYPVDWSPTPNRRWNVSLRCPDCEWFGGGTYEQELVDRFDEVLDRGTEELLDDLNALTRANIEQQADRFISAIWANEVLPEDF